MDKIKNNFGKCKFETEENWSKNEGWHYAFQMPPTLYFSNILHVSPY